MKFKTAAMALLLAGLSAAPAQALQTFGGFMAGYDGGLSFHASGGINNFAQGFPLGLELELGYAIVEPGDALRARRVFINENTNGTPEKFGSTININLNFLYPLKIKGPKALYVYAGPRLAMFDAHFHYVGGNETFDVTSNPWGLGTGVKGVFAITKSLDFIAVAGLAYYFPAAITGHDSIYYPNNSNVNAKEDFTYQDAANAVNVPKFQPSFMLGLGF
jgi:hypothetical protein